jgi:cysteinyl-tRNA synthetase
MVNNQSANPLFSNQLCYYIYMQSHKLTLYNTFTNSEQEFTPINPQNVTVYTCGPTVYGRPHIGNYSSFLMADLLVRLLEQIGYNVTHVKNITDVGHLVADATADASGEDKIEKQAKAEAVDPLTIAEKYTEQYLADEVALNFREMKDEHRPRATKYVQQMLEITKTLIQKGHVYETDDGYYFAVTTFPQYGELSGNTLDNVQAGARIEVNTQKRHPADFAVWKKCVAENSHHMLRWSFTTGERVTGDTEDAAAGFPGWHIECSAMSSSLLGTHIDIHTGGEDNIFPHHECEIAQSECAFGGKFANYWLHRRRINLGDQKMSKSLGNIVTLDTIKEWGFSPLDLRYYLLTVHYRTQLKFTQEGLEAASIARNKIVQWVKMNGGLQFARAQGLQEPYDITKDDIKVFYDKFMDSLCNDLNTPAALASIFECLNFIYQPDRGFYSDASELLGKFASEVQAIFACFEDTEDPKEIVIPQEVLQLQEQRATARANKDFAESDRLRDEIAKLGFIVKDTANGQVIEGL